VTQTELDTESSLVHALTEAGTENAVNFDGGIDNRASQSVNLLVRLSSWRLGVLAISHRKRRFDSSRQKLRPARWLADATNLQQ
jgi:hypothetical protein